MNKKKNVEEIEDLSSRVVNSHYFDIDIEDRIIYLIGIEDHPTEEFDEPGIEYRTSNRFIKNINLLNKTSDEPIIVCMKSCGGDWDEGMAIYDAIKTSRSPVTILNYTHARSMTSIILQAATKRVMMPNSTFMFHQGQYGDSGTMKSVKSAWDFYTPRTDEIMLEIYINSMKKRGKAKAWSKVKIKEWLVKQMNDKEEVYLTSKEAVDWGFADEIFSSWDNLT